MPEVSDETAGDSRRFSKAGHPDGRPAETAAWLGRIASQYGEFTIVAARIILLLSAAGDGGLSQPDLSEQLGFGRDATKVQRKVADLVAKGVVRSERRPSSGDGGSYLHLTLVQKIGKRTHRSTAARRREHR